MMVRRLAIWFALGCGVVFGDGIPVTEDRRHLVGDHTVFALKQEQRLEVERRRQVTLTDEQVGVLRGICPRPPRRLEVISSRYDDCTCDLGPVGIWCRPGEIDIPHFLMRFASADDNAPVDKPGRATTREADEPAATPTETLILDSTGAVFRNGQAVTDDALEQVLKDLLQRPAPDEERWLLIRVPPPVDAATDLRIKEWFDGMELRCAKQKITALRCG